jgi:hypothetical protein
MQVLRALKSKRQSVHFPRRLSIFLILVLLVVSISLLALRGFSEFSVAGDFDYGTDTSFGSTGSITAGSSASSHDESDYGIMSVEVPTPTPTPSPTPTPTPTYSPEATPIPLESTPEFEVGGATVALLVCFLAFGLFIKSGGLKAIRK